MKEFLKKLKSFSGFVGSASVLIPGISFFFKYSPPLFDGIWILVSALSAAFLWFGFKSIDKKQNDKNSLKFVLIGFLLSVIYLIILDETSILVKSGDEKVRYQIGWNMSNWGLKKEAINKIENNLCTSIETKEDILNCFSATRVNTFRIWKDWTIYFFGIFNILIFTISSLLWSYGWGKIIKTDG